MTEALADRVVLVTGARRGIGLAVGLRFLEHGARVVFQSRSAVSDLRVLESVEKGNAVTVRADLRDAHERAEIFHRIGERFGLLDVLVNNAGVQQFEAIDEIDMDKWESMLRVNLVAAVDCMRRALGVMTRPDADRCVINLVSVRATRPGAGASAYAASKAALLSATRSAAVEFGPLGIRVNAISPGLVWREGLEKEWPEGVKTYREQAPLHRIGSPDEIADACVMLASPAARWITGIDLVVDGGISLVR